MDHHQLEQIVSSIARQSLRSGKYSDFSIRCSDGTIIRAHRAVVCPRSRVLTAAIDGKFQEAVSQEIYLEDDQPDIVARLIDFLYGIDYDDYRSAAEGYLAANGNQSAASPPFGNNSDEIPIKHIPVDTEQSGKCNPLSLITNAKVYIIADKYDVQALKEWATTKYKEVLPKSWNNSAFTESARIIYDNTPETDRMLRDVIVQGASENVNGLLDRGEFVDLLKSHGAFATDVLRNVVSNFESPTETQEKELEDMWGSWGTKKDKKKGR